MRATAKDLQITLEQLRAEVARAGRDASRWHVQEGNATHGIAWTLVMPGTALTCKLGHTRREAIATLDGMRMGMFLVRPYAPQES